MTVHTSIPSAINILKMQSLGHCLQTRGFTIELCKEKHADMLSQRKKNETVEECWKYSPTCYRLTGTQERAGAFSKRTATVQPGRALCNFKIPLYSFPNYCCWVQEDKSAAFQ